MSAFLTIEIIAMRLYSIYCIAVLPIFGFGLVYIEIMPPWSTSLYEMQHLWNYNYSDWCIRNPLHYILCSSVAEGKEMEAQDNAKPKGFAGFPLTINITLAVVN